VLVTNAHPATLGIKDEQVALRQYFDACYSTHAFSFPKEDAQFWPRLEAQEGFEAARTLFVDDSLPVLHAARDFGIGWLRAIRRPDSSLPPQPTGDFAAVDRVADLM
jgi:putative hydrolase of the HAD superfamily